MHYQLYGLVRRKKNQVKNKKWRFLLFTKLATDIPLSNLGIQKVDGKFTEGPRYMDKTIKSFKMVERPQEKFPKFD